RTGAGDDEVYGARRKALSREVERRDDAIDSLFGCHASDVEPDEGLAGAIGRAQCFAASAWREELRIDAAPPDFDVMNTDGREVASCDVRWRVDAPRSAVEFSEVARNGRPEPADAVRLRVA